MTNLEGSSSRGGASKKTETGRESGQSVSRKRRVHSTKALGHYGGESAKSLSEGVRIKASRYGYNQGKNQVKF